MTEIEFRALAAQGYNRIPLLVECLADLDTPLSLYVKLIDRQRRANSFLLESVVGGERFGRYSFIGLPSRTLLRARGDAIEVVRDNQVIESSRGDPLEFVRQFQARFRVALRPGLPRFCGGLAGYFGYDAVRFIEPRLGPSIKPDPIGTPDVLMLLVDELAIVDNLSGKLYLIVYADPTVPDAYTLARRRLRELQARLAQRPSNPKTRRCQPARPAANLPATTTSRPWRVPRSTSSPVMSCRCRSASVCESPSCIRRCRCIGRCARSTRRPTCTTTISMVSR
jgi:anthranilate synthase component 1